MIRYAIHACLLTAGGRPNKAMIPPHSVREITTDGTFYHTDFAFLIADLSLAAKCIWPAGTPIVLAPCIDQGPIRIAMYNGGLESYYIEHEQRIAELVIL